MPRPAKQRDVCQTIADEVRSYCIRKADPARAAKYARYFVEGYDAYGLDHKDPEWESSLKDWGERLRAAGPAAFLDAGDMLMRSGKYEEASFAILFARDASDRYSPEVFARIGCWFESGGIRNWGHTDVLCGEVLSAFVQRGVIGFEELRKWVASKHKYQRRAVPVMLIKQLDAADDVGPLFQLIEPLMSDTEKVVQQGSGWFLREAWKRKPRAAEAFLLRHKDHCPRLIVQYATEKMDAKSRERFRKKK
ncbi:MAG TPA: DNA alkylation repair protein [Bryobacteraceae bacterium]